MEALKRSLKASAPGASKDPGSRAPKKKASGRNKAA
jgi:hypothetical protein